MSWWNEFWLNEGFTSYISFIVANEIDSSIDFTLLFLIEDYNEAILADIDGIMGPVSPPPETMRTNQDHMTMIGPPAYFKGASIVAMVRKFVKPTKFARGLQTYLYDFQYRATSQGKLLFGSFFN